MKRQFVSPDGAPVYSMDLDELIGTLAVSLALQSLEQHAYPQDMLDKALLKASIHGLH